jgi:hypothetical protein
LDDESDNDAVPPAQDSVSVPKKGDIASKTTEKSKNDPKSEEIVAEDEFMDAESPEKSKISKAASLQLLAKKRAAKKARVAARSNRKKTTDFFEDPEAPDAESPAEKENTMRTENQKKRLRVIDSDSD